MIMGSCMSLRLASSSSGSSSNNNKKRIRVVHLNGWTEEFEDAMTVGQLTGGEQHHFVFAQAQLASLLNSKPLDSATQLQMGSIYFLLPHSIFNTEMSPIDLATISKRLTLAAAQKKPDLGANKKKKKKKKKQTTVISRNRYADRYVPPRINDDRSCRVAFDVDINDKENSLLVIKQKMMQQQEQVGEQSPCSWKPILESITERSFTFAESDSSHQDKN